METKYTRSILDINNGSIIRDLDRELAKVMVNLADVATDDKPREINLKLKFTPKNDKKEMETFAPAVFVQGLRGFFDFLDGNFSAAALFL